MRRGGADSAAEVTEFTCEFVASAALSRIAQVDGRTPVAATRVGGGESVECTGIDHTPRARLSGEDSSDDVACGNGADRVHVEVDPFPSWLNNQVQQWVGELLDQAFAPFPAVQHKPATVCGSRGASGVGY